MSLFTIDQLRDDLISKGHVGQEASDAQLVTRYSELTGKDVGTVANYFGVETGADSSAFGAGISAGADTLQSLGYSALAAGSRALGAEDTSESFMRSAEAEQYEAFLTGKPEYERIEDQDSLGDYFGYGAYQIGKQLPIMSGITAASLATGGLGAGLTALRGVGSASGAFQTGARIGGYGSSYGVGVGSLYGSAYEAEQQGTPANLGEVFVKAVPYAVAEALLPRALTKAAISTGSRPVAKNRFSAGAQAGLGGVVTEGATELAQTELEISMNPYLSEEEKYSQRLNAAVAGGVSGGAISGGVGLIAGPRKTGTEEKDLAPTQPKEEAPSEEAQVDLDTPTVLRRQQGPKQQSTAVETSIDETELDIPTILRRAKVEREVVDVDTQYVTPGQQARREAEQQAQAQQEQETLVEAELTAFDETLKEAIAGRKQVPAGRRKVEENKLATVQAELDGVNEQLAAIKSVGFGRKNKKAKVANAKRLEARKKVLETKRDEIQGKLDVVDAGKQASEKRKELRKATKAYTKGVAFNELTTEQQALLRQASPTIAFNNPEQVEEVAPIQDVEQEVEQVNNKKPEAIEQEPEVQAELSLEDELANEDAVEKALDKLDAIYSSEQGKARGRLTLKKQVINGIMRMLRDENVEPRGRVTLPKSNKTDIEATAEYGEFMEAVYTAAMDVIKTAKDMYDAEQQAVRSVDPDKKESMIQPNSARRAFALRKVLKNKVEEFIKIAGSETDAEAIIEALKTRNEKTTAKDSEPKPELFAEIAGEINRQEISSRKELGEVIDTLLSVPFADYKNGQLDDSDVVSSRRVRYSNKTEASPSITKKLQEYAKKGYVTLRSRKRVTGFLGILESITDAGGTDTAYEKALAGGIKKALLAMREEGIKDVNVKFLEDTNDDFPSYNPVTHTITISKNSSKEEILHEGLHAVTQWFVESNPDSEQVTNLSAALNELFDAVDNGVLDNINLPPWQKQEALDVINLLRDLRDEGRENAAVLELVSYGTTMHSLKKVLKGINAVDSKPDTKNFYDIVTDIWRRLIGVIKAAINAPDSVAEAVVENTFWLLDNVIAETDAEQFEGTRTGAKLNYGYDPTSDAMPSTPSGNQEGDTNLSKYSRLNRDKVLSFEAFFDFIHWDKGVKAVSKRLNKVAEKIREEYPAAQRWISFINANFNANDNATKHIKNLKKTIQVPQVAANYIAERLKYESPENVIAILSYLDGDTKAIEGLKDYARLEDTARQLREKIDLFASILPEEQREVFINGKFSEALLFVNTSKDLATGSSLKGAKIGDLLRRQVEAVEAADIDSNPEFFRVEGNKVDLTGTFYKVTVTPRFFDSYTLFIDSEVYENLNGDLPITDAMYKVDTTIEYTSAGKDDKSYRFKAKRNYKELMDKDKAERYAYAIENTIHALSSNYATRNFAKNMVEYGSGDYVLDDEVQFANWKNDINAERAAEGKKPLDYKLLEGDDLTAANSEMVEKYRSNVYWVKVPQGYGELSGKIIHGPVWAYMHDATDRAVPFEELAEITRLYKKTKTVYNPGTQITNVASNVALMVMHDISFSTLFDAIRIMKDYQFNPGKLRPWEREMIAKFESTGALVGNFSAQEVTQAIHDSMKESITSDSDKSIFGQTVAMIKSQFKAGAALGKLGDFANRADKIAVDMYAAGDNMFRLALFMKTAAEQTELAGLNKPDDKIYDASAEAAKKGFMDYDIDEKSIRYLRATALPFVSWFFRATQVVGKLAVTKPWKLAKLLTVWALLDALMAGMAGDDEERRKAGDPKLQERLFGIGPNMHMRIPFFGDDGEAIYYRIGDYFPLGTSFKGIPNGFAGLDWWPSAITPSGPILAGTVALMGGVNPYTGQKLSGPTDTTTDAFIERMKAIYDMMGVPALRSSNIETMYDMAFEGGKKDIIGKELSWTYLALAKVGGLKIVEHSDVKEATLRKIRERAVYRDFSAAVRKAKRDAFKTGYVDYEELDAKILDLYERQKEEIDAIYQLEDE